MMRAPKASDFITNADDFSAEPKFRLLLATVEQAASGIWVPHPGAPVGRDKAAAAAFGHGLLTCREWHYQGEHRSPLLLLMLQPVDGD